MNLATILTARVAEVPDRVGLVYEDGREFTFRALDDLSAKSGNFMRSLGVAAGSRVGLMLPNIPEMFVILFGAWRIGASAATINTMYQVKELDHAIHTSGIDVLFVTAEQLPMLDELKGHLKTVVVVGDAANDGVASWERGIASASADCPVSQPGADDEACILFTSGSTGAPKAVITTHTGWLKTLDVLAQGSTGKPGPYPYQDGKAPNIITFPLVHSGGQQSTLFALTVGRAVLLMRKFEVEKYARIVEKYRIDNMVLMPPMIHDLVHYDKPVDFSSVNSLFAVGQELPMELKKAFEQKFKVPVLYNYGSTEAGHVAGWNMKEVMGGKWKPGSLGRIYKGVQCEIRDENDQPLPRGTSGEIVVKTEVTTKGYTEQKEGSDMLIKDGWLYTGDLGYLDDDDVLFFTGRKREMIKVGGFQVSPVELVEVLAPHPKIKDLVVLGVPHERLGVVPKAFIVLKEKCRSADEAEQLKADIIAYCRDNIAHYKAIRAVQFIDEIPRSESGKVLKPKVLEMHTENRK